MSRLAMEERGEWVAGIFVVEGTDLLTRYL